MSFFCRLTRRHYWCTPHRSAENNKLVQVCYECGAERAAIDLTNDVSSEWIKHSIASARAELSNLSSQKAAERVTPQAPVSEPIAVGQGGSGRLLLVK
jgi:hypothetical protein